MDDDAGTAKSGAIVAMRGGLSTLLFQGLKFIVGFGAMAAIARILEPSDFGLFAMALAVAGIAEIIRDFGFLNAGLQAKTLTRKNQTALFWSNLSLGMCAAVIVFLSAPLAAIYFGRTEVIGMLQLFSIVFILNGAGTQYKVRLIRAGRLTAVNAAEFTGLVIGSTIAVVAALGGLTYWAFVLQHIFAASVTLIVLIMKAKWAPGLPTTLPESSLLRYGGSVTAQQSLAYAVRNADTLVIGRYLGAAALGYYDRAYQFLMIPIAQLNAPLTRVAVPALAAAWRQKRDFEARLRTTQAAVVFLSVPIYGIMTGAAGSLVYVILGPGWEESALILSILAAGGVFRSLMQMTYWAYLSSGQTSRMLKFDLVAMPIVAASIALSVIMGTTGVAVAHSTGYMVYWFAGLYWMSRGLQLAFSRLLGYCAMVVAVIYAPVVLVSKISETLVEDAFLSLIAAVAASVAMLGIATLATPALRKEAIAGLRLLRSMRKDAKPSSNIAEHGER